jgi:hypothetical protein
MNSALELEQKRESESEREEVEEKVQKKEFRHGELNPGLLGPGCSFERYESEKS